MSDNFDELQATLQRLIADRAKQGDLASAMRQVDATIGTAVKAMMDNAKTGAKEQAAMRSMFQQMGASLADIVELMEADQKQEDTKTPAEKRAEDEAEAQIKAKAMAEAFVPVLSSLKIPAPRVDVTVPPADKAGQKWRIEVDRGDQPKMVMTVIRM